MRYVRTHKEEGEGERKKEEVKEKMRMGRRSTSPSRI